MRKIKMVSRCRLAGTIKRKKEKQEKDISAYHNDRKRLQKVWFYLDVTAVNMNNHGMNIKLRPR